MTEKELIELFLLKRAQGGLNEKDDLQQLWEETPSDADVDMPEAKKLYSIARNTERAMNGYFQPRNFMPWILATACVILAFVAVYVFMPEPVTRLVSSSTSKGFFELPDGSLVWLNKGSSLTYTGELNGKTRQLTLEGEAFFDVSHDAEHPFIVHSKDMDITVTGTRFTLTSYPELPGAVYLEEGSVIANGRAFPETRLAPGQGIVFDDNTLLWKKIPILSADHTDWTKEYLVFTNTAVADVFASLEHWFHISLSCSNRDFLENTRISMTVRQETPENVLESIALLTGISYTREEGNRFIIRK